MKIIYFEPEKLIHDNNLQHQFQNIVYSFYKDNKRSFFWRTHPLPYYVLISEYMSQQTQMSRVEKFFGPWIDAFPSINALADAPFDMVLSRWMGLGYNRRALNLHKSAQIIKNVYHGNIPTDKNALEGLPGIGSYTSSAIMSFAYNIPTVLIETNIRAVYIAHCFLNYKQTNENKNTKIPDSLLKPLIEGTIDPQQPREWYYALMDYGAYLKKILNNPTQKSSHYAKQSKFKGSKRECRAEVLKFVLKHENCSYNEIISHLACKNISKDYHDNVIQELTQEKLIYLKNNTFKIQ